MTESPILFTRQRHEAEKAGLHFDYRMVINGVAKSWATFKELPKIGENIVLWEQPDHTVHYALSKKVVIPSGQYGAGVTTLDFVKRGKAEVEADKYVLNLNDGSRFLLKKVSSYGDGAWLFRNLGPKKEPGELTKKACELLEKQATTLEMWQQQGTEKTTWVVKGSVPTGDNWVKTKASKHVFKNLK